jgi:transposase
MGKGSTTRRYTDEFKRDAVALFRSSGRTIKEVARGLGISDPSLGTFVRQWEKTAPSERVERLEAEAEIARRLAGFSAPGPERLWV